MPIKKTHEDFVNELKSKNILYTPLSEYINKRTKILFRCENGHTFKCTPDSILHGCGCSVCSGRSIEIGYNDLWTTNPDIALCLKNKNDGYMVSFGSHKILQWICPNCGNEITKSVNEVTSHGLLCKVCSDGISYSEKYITQMLLQLGYEFQREKIFEWSNSKRYDFYIKKHSLIIETHGLQHYSESTNFARSLLEEQENDKYKEQLAINNGIKYYIQLDCRESNGEYLKKSIFDSKLSEIFNLSKVNWNLCDIYATDVLSIQIVDLWHNNCDIKIIAKKLNVGETCVRKYLHKMSELGLCNYDSKLMHIKSNIDNLGKKVVCVETEKIYDSIGSVANDGFIPQRVSLCCNNKAKTHKKYHWKFYKEVS